MDKSFLPRGLDCRRASLDDIEEIMPIIAQAQQFLAMCGVDQWQDGFPNPEVIGEDISLRRSFVLLRDGKTIAYVCLATAEEEVYAKPLQGAFQLEGQYGTVHRTAIAESERGSGLSHLLFELCERECRTLGIKALRVDTHRDNARMRHIICREGFEERAVVLLGNGTERIAYEKAL